MFDNQQRKSSECSDSHCTVVESSNRILDEDSTPRRLLRRGSTIALDTCSRDSVRNSVLAGYVAGICGTLIGHPFDSLKVWMQTQQHTHQNLLSLKQARNLYNGVYGPLVTVGLVQSINFGIYDATRRMLYGWQHPNRNADLEYLSQSSLWHVAVASMTAGTVLACFTLPMLQIKTKQQTRGISFREGVGELSVSRRLTAGWGPHVLAETVGRAVYFCSYEGWKSYLNNNKDLTLYERMLCAMASGTLCWAVIYPLDVLRNRLFYLQQEPSSGQHSAWKVAQSIYDQHGWRGLYRGITVTVLRAGPVAATVLPVYDITLNYLNRSMS